MKSRLLSTAAALFLLLGLVSTSAFAQVSSSAAVDFLIQTYQSDGDLIGTWHNTASTDDTVGRKMDVRASWETASQSLSSVSYTVTLPVGTVLMAEAADSVFLKIYDGFSTAGTPQTILVDPSDVTLVQNDTSGYSGTVRPSITVASTISFNEEKTLQIEVMKGIYIGKVMTQVNSTADDKLLFSLNISSQAGTTFNDSSSMAAINDLVDGVQFNSAIAAYIDDEDTPFPSSDSIIFIDRFGNYVPDYPAAVTDSIIISVPTGAGYFGVDSVNSSNSATSAYTAKEISYVDAADSTSVFLRWTGALVNTTGALTTGHVYHQLSTGTSSMVLLGRRPGTGAVTAGGAGLAFNGTDAQDSTTFTVTVRGTVATGTVLNTAASGSSSITRAREDSDVGKQIGSLSAAWTTGGVTYVGGLLNGSLALTVKNVFGENFANGAVGTVTDPVNIMFAYVDSGGTVNDTKTGQMAAGMQVNSVYSMPATTLDASLGAGASTTDVIDGNAIEGTLASSVLTISQAATNAPVYLGMASHPIGDSIAVIVYAANDMTKIDTFKINVEPGVPVAFDVDTLKLNLAAASLTKNTALNANLPMVALDTAYNKVYNLDLLNSSTPHLDGISLPSSGGIGTIKAINIMIDGRDPAGYDMTTAPDSIKFAYLGARPTINADGISNTDTSYIGDVNVARTDSSVINIGGIGTDSLGLRLLYTGINRVISAKWDPAQLGSGFTFTAREADIGLFTLVDTTAIDSAQSLTIVSSTHKAGQVDTMDISFVLPTGNTIDQNSADSLIFVQFCNMAGAAGLPVGLTKENVEVSLDAGANWYASLGVSDITSEDEDSVWIATPITLNAASSAKTVRVRILNFVNPTMANVDSAGLYGMKVKTEATPVVATAADAAVTDKFVAYDAASLLIVAENDTLSASYPRWTSDVVNLTDAVAVQADMATLVQLLRVDMYGNIVNGEAGNTTASTHTVVISSLDSTALGASLSATSTYANAVQSSRAGADGVDTLLVTTDAAGGAGSYADSVEITPQVSNGGTEYYIVIADSISATAAKDSFLVAVYNTVASTITIDPDSNMTGARGAALPTLSVTLKDSLGNLVTDSLVSFGLYNGDVTGAFSDTNGVALVAGVDTVAASTGSDGVATAVFTAGQLDSVAIKVWTGNVGVTAKYFTASLSVVGSDMAFTIVSPTDSLVPSLTTAKTITANVTDANDVTKVWANVWRSALTLNAENTFDTADAVAYDHAVEVVIGSPTDSVQVALALPDSSVAIDTALVIKYQLVGVDALDDTTYSDTMMYVVAPTRGKRDMTSNAVNVADVMRLVYLIAIDEITPTVVDYLGLDLDQDGSFDTPDLTAELDIWKGTGTLLAGAESLENATATTSLSYEATDKATANLALNLESSHNMNVAVIRIKYDTEKFVFGDAKATDRLRNISVVSDANENDGVYTIVMINAEGGQILQGSGAVLNIAISAVGEKFDGVGDISLLNASFDEGVSAELSREVLSPKALLPKAFALSQNYPNPFNPSTTIAYDVPEGDNVQVQLNVYNMRGQLVKTLVNDAKGEGSYQVQWDGSDNYGRRVSSGVFFYRIKAGEFSKTRKMVILK